VSPAGDVNGDGFADFLVGAGAVDRGTGAAHFYLGEAVPDVNHWNGSAPVYRIDLQPSFGDGNFGDAIATVGDVNGDGYSDFIIGAGGADKQIAHLYLGNPCPLDKSITCRTSFMANWNGTSPINRIDITNAEGAKSGFGAAVAGAGDVNGDGYADFVVGAWQANFNAGAADLYLGVAQPSKAAWNGPTATNRIRLTSPDGSTSFLGTSVGGAGDINGDGYADFLVSAYPKGGTVHVYFGEPIGAASQIDADWNGALYNSAKRIDIISPNANIGSFGNALAGTGDVDRDGYGDFLVGNRAESEYLGAATWCSGQSLITKYTASYLFYGLINPDPAYSQFGSAVY
jgi:hypothetical protein